MNQNTSLILKSDKSKYIRSFFSSLIFSILSFKMISGSSPLAGWILASFFIFAAVASIIPVLPGQSFIKLDISGFTIRSMFRSVHIKWHEIENFETAKRSMKDTVVYTFINKGMENRNYLNIENLLGKKEVLPDNYGMKPAALADLLEFYRIRYSYSGYEV